MAHVAPKLSTMERVKMSSWYDSMMSSEQGKKLIAWATERAETTTYPISFATSSDTLRALLKTKLLSMTELHANPEWFFEAHRVMASFGPELGQGFWTRFTVQYNLFAGTVLAVGNENQVKKLEEMQEEGELGCFGLTEKFAGVSSGMVVETVAVFDPERREFVINSPTEGSKKNWISQGFVADKGVVIADLIVNQKSFGPHAFLIDFRVKKGSEKVLVNGIRLADMGPKTVSNDLDNAWIEFTNLRVGEECLLNKFAEIDSTGEYVSKNMRGGRTLHPMLQIGQRLFTGRVAVAQAALIFGRSLFGLTRNYTDNKLCWAPKGQRPPLSMLPQLSWLYEQGDEAFTFAEEYIQKCEKILCDNLRSGTLPSPALTDKLAVGKIRSVETVIWMCFRLKQAVGSYALMQGSGFESTDVMQVAKFAEGESFVLMQKLARDRVKRKSEDKGGKSLEEEVVDELKGCSGMEWVEKTDKVYLLAELVMDRLMETTVGRSLPQGIARPFAPQLAKL